MVGAHCKDLAVGARRAVRVIGVTVGCGHLAMSARSALSSYATIG